TLGSTTFWLAGFLLFSWTTVGSTTVSDNATKTSLPLPKGNSEALNTTCSIWASALFTVNAPAEKIIIGSKKAYFVNCNFDERFLFIIIMRVFKTLKLN